MNVKFGTDGMRGTREVITNDAARSIGAASTVLFGPNCVLVSDTRIDNPEIAQAFTDGVEGEGGTVINLGVLPTPAGAFIASDLMQKEGKPFRTAALTASHNPATDYGIKISGLGGRKLNEADTAALQDLANSIEIKSLAGHTTQPTSRNMYEYLREGYINMVISSLHPELRTPDFLKGKNIAYDAANGATYQTGPEILSRLGADVLRLNDDPKAEINKDCGAEHAYEHPDYSKGMLTASRADIVLIADGDGDRLMADVKGRRIDGDDLVTIAVKSLLIQNLLRKKAVVVTGYSNLGFLDHMEAIGIEVIEVDNGDRFVLEAMGAGDYQVGGEFSGHILHREAVNRMGLVMSGDTILTALQMFEAEVMTGQSIAGLSNWKRLPQKLDNIKLPAGVNAELFLQHPIIVEAIKRNMERLGSKGRILIRPSGTQPLIRVLGKAYDQRVLDEVMADLNNCLSLAA